MKEISLQDSCFSHVNCFDGVHPGQYFVFDRDCQNKKCLLMTDNNMYNIKKVRSDYQHIIGWHVEPRAINSKIYDYVKSNQNLFDMIFTYDSRLIETYPEKYKPYYGCGSWLKDDEMGIHHKTKNVSIIASLKNLTAGHQLRHKVIQSFRDKIDLVCGNGYQQFNSKLFAFQDYRYSIVIENSIQDTYFTDKLLDCFLTGTIPIFWGSSKVLEVFNDDGIYMFNSLDDLEKILTHINKEDYEARKKSIYINFEIAKDLICVEDFLFNQYLKDIL